VPAAALRRHALDQARAAARREQEASRLLGIIQGASSKTQLSGVSSWVSRKKTWSARPTAHLERSRWLLGPVSRALAMHMADEVWAGVERHLFGDREGRRSGMPRVGSYWNFLRIAGRARSHTTEHKWETFRIFGTLAGHLAAYRHPELPEEIASPAGGGEPAVWHPPPGPASKHAPGRARGFLVGLQRPPDAGLQWRPRLPGRRAGAAGAAAPGVGPLALPGPLSGSPGAVAQSRLGAAAGCLGQRRLGLRGAPDDPGRGLLLARQQGPPRSRR